jgi:hypothetical protein
MPPIHVIHCSADTAAARQGNSLTAQLEPDRT